MNTAQELNSDVIYLMTVDFLPVFFPIMYFKPIELLISPEFQAKDILIFTSPVEESEWQ